MSLRSIAGATLGASLLLAASTSAHAVVINPGTTIFDPDLTNNTADGGVYGLASGPYVWDALFQNIDPAGNATFLIKNNTAVSAVVSTVVGTVLQGPGGYFTGGVTASWLGGDSDTITTDPNHPKPGVFDLERIFAPFETATLMIMFGKPVEIPNGKPGINLQISADFGPGGNPGPGPVPLPAPALLLLSGLAGLGFLARKKAAI